MAKVKFVTAPEPAEIGARLIGQYHRHLEESVKVFFAFSEEEMKSKGKEVWGKAQKIGGLHAHLAGYEEEFFCITLSLPIWARLNDKQKEALVDHELCHCDAVWDDDGDEVKLTTVGHDIEEFNIIVKRYGDWAGDIKAFLAAAREGGQIHMELEPV